MFELPAIELSTKARSSPALWLSEVIATIGLLLVINGCVRSGRAAAVPFAVGAWIGGAYFFTSSTSFANPAVTVARTLSDTFAGIRPSSAPAFIVCQLIGAAIAVGLIRLFYPHTTEAPDVDSTVPRSCSCACTTRAVPRWLRRCSLTTPVTASWFVPQAPRRRTRSTRR